LTTLHVAFIEQDTVNDHFCIQQPMPGYMVIYAHVKKNILPAHVHAK
jgi:hypothetical protein